MLTPALFLSLLIATTVVAAVVQVVERQRQISRLRQLASRWQMHYTSGDRFRLAPRVAPMLPIPGAASIRIRDVIYGSEGDAYRYYFTANYTTGVLKRKHDENAVCTTTESKSRDRGNELTNLGVAPSELPLLEQYEHLKKSA